MKSVFKYQLNAIKIPILIYYLVIACVLALIAFDIMTSSTIWRFDADLEITSGVFLFICGLNMFRETFRMSIQNGVSRKRIWTGAVLTFLTVGAGMALIDTVIRMALVNSLAAQNRLEIRGLNDLMCASRSMNNGFFQNAFEGLLLNFCLYFAALAVGYFITLGYYRMNKIAKIAVSIGVPGFFMFVLPVADFITNYGIINTIYKIITNSFGESNGRNPFFSIGIGLSVSAVFLGLAYLMIRRAPIKD